MVRKLIGRLMIDSGQIFITDPAVLIGDGLPPVYVIEDEHGTILKIEIDFQNINLPSDPI